MKSLDVVDGMARWIIVHGEAARAADAAAADAVSTSGELDRSHRFVRSGIFDCR